MYTDENKAIRYLMKEMDPSEEMEFEKLMREDENLLIEVESLRATKRRLSELTPQNPPQTLTKKITDDAKQLQSQKLKKAKFSTSLFRQGMAAAVFLSIFVGGGYFYYDDVSEAANSETTTVSKNVEPWVDRNEVLKYTETLQVSQSSAIQTDISRSYEKLELVNDPSGSTNKGSGIMLTGSAN